MSLVFQRVLLAKKHLTAVSILCASSQSDSTRAQGPGGAADPRHGVQAMPPEPSTRAFACGSCAAYDANRDGPCGRGIHVARGVVEPRVNSGRFGRFVDNKLPRSGLHVQCNAQPTLGV